ncbi:MAG: sodium:proton antiporter, partial [Arcobacteraceae bacterium]|nr:sodium:proton antiporter [Arcobacteraceae bacterium]
MIKVFMTLIMSCVFAFASMPGEVVPVFPDITMTWVGISSLIIFVVGYYFIATEDKYHIDKAKP